MSESRNGWTSGEILTALLADAVLVEGVSPPPSWFEEAPGWHEVEAPAGWAMDVGLNLTWLAEHSDPCGGNTRDGGGCTCEPPFVSPRG